MLQKYKLEITLFLSGATVMIFEILGSRIYGPYFGTSTFVWTSLIGVILGSLSLGYYIGGIQADKQANLKNLSLILFFASVGMFGVFLMKEPLLLLFQSSKLSLELATFISSIIIFGPVSFLLGLVSPFAVKLKLDRLAESGRIVGKMYAIGTLGSIVGTFAAGFFLIPVFGTNLLLLSLCFSLIFLSLFVSKKDYKIVRGIYFILLLFVFALQTTLTTLVEAKGLIDVDTKYSRIKVYDYTHSSGSRAKVMQINTENHSSMFLDNDDLTNEYTKYYHLIKVFNPNFQHGLMIGGAGYSFPKDYLKAYPEKTLDVLEIDSGVTELARKYFRLQNNENLKIFHRDAREYLNTTSQKYDVIFGDAFSSYYSIPYQLTTLETVQKKYDILNDNGVVLLNVISGIEGNKGKFLRAEYRTYKDIFPQVYVIPVQKNYNGKSVKNLMLVAMKTKEKFDFSKDYGDMQGFLENTWTQDIDLDIPILYDDYAPVNSYIADALKS